MTFQIVKVSDDGSSSPFVARLWFGILTLREDAVRVRWPGEDFEQQRDAFDDVYDPVLSAVRACRTAKNSILTMVSTHAERVSSGAIVSFQPRAVSFSESIDIPLHDATSRLLVQGVIALKAVQAVTRFFDVEIGPFFQKPTHFEEGMLALRGAGHTELEGYLRAARLSWTESFIEQRAALEHEGWVLPRVRYVEVGSRQYRLEQPTVCRLPVSAFASLSVRRLQGFIENVIVYTLKKVIQRPPLFVVEIPPDERDPTLPCRFRYAFGPEWRPIYDDNDFEE